MHSVLAQVLQTVQDWLRELHLLHDENISHREIMARMKQENLELRNKVQVLGKSDQLLASSLRQIGLASESLDGPIKNEI